MKIFCKILIFRELIFFGVWFVNWNLFVKNMCIYLKIKIKIESLLNVEILFIY